MNILKKRENCGKRLTIKQLWIISSSLFFLLVMFLNVSTATANPLLQMEDLSCEVMPTKEIRITSDSVQLSEKDKTWLISVDGDVSMNGKLLTLTSEQQNRARAHQKQLRQDLPWLKNSAQKLINENIALLDSAIVEQLGEKSGLRAELQKFKPTVNQFFESIIREDNKEMHFSAIAINNIEDRIQELVNQHGGSLIQTAMTEYTTSQLFKPKSQRISLDKLVDLLNAKFAGQEKQARAILKTTCEKFADWKNAESQFIK